MNKLKFISLIDPSKYENYNKDFPNTIFENLRQSNFRNEFDFIRLKNELTVFYTYEELSNSSPYDIVNKIKINNLVSVFQEVFKLGQLFLVHLLQSISIF